MDASGKITIGVAVTALLAWSSHAAMGSKFLDNLESKAEASLAAQSITGVTVAAERAPSLKRILILSGDKNDAEKAGALAAVKSIPGVLGARWKGDDIPLTANAKQVARCQSDVDAVTKDKVINFRSGSAYLAPDGTRVVAEVAKILKSCVGTKVEVQGHTDLKGNPEINQSVSQARAEAVMKALITQGVPSERLAAQGYGSTKPLDDAVSMEANAKNRRTIFSVTAAAGEK